MKSGKEGRRGEICKFVIGAKNKCSAWTSKSILFSETYSNIYTPFLSVIALTCPSI